MYTSLKHMLITDVTAVKEKKIQELIRKNVITKITK